ncbi:MAG: nicotinate-nucleotide adenylyltransferase [Elusimicrobia bacterium]|nr:nicotinate-nucleotide adenylyltransferase [Elusimicrobiota bacterium]
MRIGLFGGSFDPIHNGHLKLALDSKINFNLDKVIFIPAKIPPHKKTKILAKSNHRTRMILTAIKPYPFFSLSRYEINKKSTTYTFNTLRYFEKKYPNADIFFLIGSDSLNELKSWKNIGDFKTLCSFIVAQRKGYKPDKNNKYLKNAYFTKNEIQNISSSSIRNLIKKGKTVSGLVPKSIETYIIKKKLYIK